MFVDKKIIATIATNFIPFYCLPIYFTDLFKHTRLPCFNLTAFLLFYLANNKIFSNKFYVLKHCLLVTSIIFNKVIKFHKNSFLFVYLPIKYELFILIFMAFIKCCCSSSSTFLATDKLLFLVKQS